MQNKSNETRGAVIPYIAVLLGLLVSAGILGWFISSRHTEPLPPPVTQETKKTVPQTDTTPSADIAATRLPDIASTYESEQYAHVKSAVPPTEVQASTEESAEKTASLVSRIALEKPASGDILYAYSDHLPAYNETMRDWRVHNAIDIAVVPGEIATAAADGTVVSVTEDRLLGNVITLSHFGGYQTQYANLSENPLVAEGDTVKKGDPLCEIGGSSVMELFLPEHLHFALFKDSIPLNPTEYWDE